MIRVCLCDDDNQMLETCKNKIKALVTKLNQKCSIQSFISGESLLFFMNERADQFDIIIIDMLMGNINGINTIKKIRKNGYKGVVIFLTSSKEYVIESFDVEPLGYILKDELDNGKLESFFLKGIKQLDRIHSKNLVVSTNKFSAVVIALSDILYIESDLREIKIVTEKDIKKIYYQLEKIMEQVGSLGFIRCHRAFIVNSKYIKSFNRNVVILANGMEIPIGRLYIEEFRDKYTKYCFDDVLI